MTTTNFPWDDSRLVAPATVHHLSMGGRSILFCESRQVLYGLNPTAECIWQSLAEGEPPLEARRHLADLGVPAEDARTFVEDATLSWLNGGQLAPLEALACLNQPATATRDYLIDDLGVRLDFFGVPADPLDAVFGQFAAKAEPSALRLSVVSCRDRLFLFEADSPLGSYAAGEWIPRLKAAVTEHYTARVRDAFLVHAAFLVRHGKGILISGAPGAGKTTLCVALARSGFEYHGDDIVRLESNGKAVGTPFAACVKSGAWPLVEPYVPDIASLPIYRRPDAKDVRYLKMPVAEPFPRSIDFVLLLSRQDGASPAFEPVEPLDAFSVLLESAFSSKGAITAPALKTFASAIDAAASFRFVYSSLPDAIKAVEDLTSE